MDEQLKVEFVRWTIAGIAFGCLAIVIAFLAAAGGHGSYLPAKVLFPYTMLSTLMFDPQQIKTPFVVLAIFQYPIYGAMMGLMRYRWSRLRTSLIVVVVHVSFVILNLILLKGGSFDP